MSSLVSSVVAWLVCVALACSNRCTERDLATIAAAHRDAWAAAFERRPLTDREFAGLADAQALLDCLTGI